MAAALFYTVITFKRSKKLDQFTQTNIITSSWRDAEVELEKIPPGSEHDISRKQLKHLAYMFRGKTFQLTLPGNTYRIFREGLKSAVTKAAYSYALQKFMNHLNISNPDDSQTPCSLFFI